jgi:hypothetical protein
MYFVISCKKSPTWWKLNQDPAEGIECWRLYHIPISLFQYFLQSNSLYPLSEFLLTTFILNSYIISVFNMFEEKVLYFVPESSNDHWLTEQWLNWMEMNVANIEFTWNPGGISVLMENKELRFLDRAVYLWDQS